MKKKSTYEINGDLYEFNNERLKELIYLRNPNRGAYESFYREVVSQNVGIAYDTVKGWVKNNTNPSLEDVKIIAEILNIPCLALLDCTHLGAGAAHTRLQRTRYGSVDYPFCLQYNGFSNVLDMIIGMGYDPITDDYMDSNFAERIINIILQDLPVDYALPELLGYRFRYSEDDLKNMCKNMSHEEFSDTLKNGYVDNDGNSLYDKNHKIAIDRQKFGERLLENTTWLHAEVHKELQDIIHEAESWWDYCMMPFNKLKITIKHCGCTTSTYTYGPGWANPTHEDRWQLILDILALLGLQVRKSGLCWMDEMHIDQREGEMFLAIELFNYAFD